MNSIQIHIKNQNELSAGLAKIADHKPNLIFAFGSDDFFANKSIAQLNKMNGNAVVIGCSTAGEIATNGVHDKSLVITACQLNMPAEIRTASVNIESMEKSHEAGRQLGKQLHNNNLNSIFILGRGLEVNGSGLIEGIREIVGEKVVITGGLAGDGGKFEKTFTVLNDLVSDENAVAVGFYGDTVKVAHGSMGGWKPFGPVRRVTKAKANVLFELDNQPALDLYKKYLGEEAKNLPASGLLYPFAILKDNQDTSGIIRTILGVNEEDKSLTLAGDIPQDGVVRLMHADNEGLVLGAKKAAEHTVGLASEIKDGVGVLISCVGRKLVMGDDIEDELDAVRDVFGNIVITGFYSYGEICPQEGFTECKLHNQTMTITYFYQ